MKAKRLTKLALSGVALAAVAATLGTSTYAWYVTNATATATGVNGTAQAGGTGNVLVAQASTATSAVNDHGEFKQNITFDTTNYTSTTTAAGLLPTTPVTASGTYSTVTAVSSIDSDTVWVDKEGAVQGSGNYVEFDLWLLSTSKTTVNLSYTISNTTAASDVKNQLAYANSDLPTGVTQGDSFAVNMVNALRMSVAATSATIKNGTSDVTNAIYDVAASASATSATYGSFVTGGSANGYLGAVLGATEVITTGPTAVSQTTKVIPLTVTANQEAKLHFVIWLEGTDESCFDSCNGQSFAIDFSFTGI